MSKSTSVPTRSYYVKFSQCSWCGEVMFGDVSDMYILKLYYDLCRIVPNMVVYQVCSEYRRSTCFCLKQCEVLQYFFTIY